MLQNILEKSIRPAYALLPASMRTREATVLLLAIGLQESAFIHRKQIKGPAKSFWQFEYGGGFFGVTQHHSTAKHAAQLIHDRGLANLNPREQFDQMEHDDVFAAGMARLLLWTDPKALPPLNDSAAAFDYYIRNWRPGAYSRGTQAQRTELRARWLRNYAQAMQHA